VVQCHFHNSPPRVLILNCMNPREMPGFHCRAVEVFALLRSYAALVALVGKPTLHKNTWIRFTPSYRSSWRLVLTLSFHGIPYSKELSNFEALCNISKPTNFLQWAAIMLSPNPCRLRACAYSKHPPHTKVVALFLEITMYLLRKGRPKIGDTNYLL